MAKIKAVLIAVMLSALLLPLSYCFGYQISPVLWIGRSPGLWVSMKVFSCGIDEVGGVAHTWQLPSC